MTNPPPRRLGFGDALVGLVFWAILVFPGLLLRLLIFPGISALTAVLSTIVGITSCFFVRVRLLALLGCQVRLTLFVENPRGSLLVACRA